MSNSTKGLVAEHDTRQRGHVALSGSSWEQLPSAFQLNSAKPYMWHVLAPYRGSTFAECTPKGTRQTSRTRGAIQWTCLSQVPYRRHSANIVAMWQHYFRWLSVKLLYFAEYPLLTLGKQFAECLTGDTRRSPLC